MLTWPNQIPLAAVTYVWPVGWETPIKVESCVGLDYVHGIPAAYGLTYKSGEDLVYKVIFASAIESMDIDPDKVWVKQDVGYAYNNLGGREMKNEIGMGIKSLEWVCPACDEYYVKNIPIPEKVTCKECNTTYVVNREDVLDTIISQATGA